MVAIDMDFKQVNDHTKTFISSNQNKMKIEKE